MATQQQRCNFYCDHATVVQLRRLAADRRIPLSQCIRACLAEYFTLRADLAATVAEPGQLGEVHTGFLHRILSASEARIAASFTAQGQQLVRMQREIRALQAMLDRAVLMYLLHTAEVPDEQRQTADTSGKRRHDQWRKAVTRLLQNGSVAALFQEEEDYDAHAHRRETTSSS